MATCRTIAFADLAHVSDRRRLPTAIDSKLCVLYRAMDGGVRDAGGQSIVRDGRRHGVPPARHLQGGFGGGMDGARPREIVLRAVRRSLTNARHRAGRGHHRRAFNRAHHTAMQADIYRGKQGDGRGRLSVASALHGDGRNLHRGCSLTVSART